MPEMAISSPVLVFTSFANTSVFARPQLNRQDALAKNQIDIGITYIPIPHPAVDCIRVSTVEMGVYGQAAFRKVPFHNLPFVTPIVPITGAPTKVRGLDGWPDGDVHRTVSFRVTMMESALELCRKGLAGHICPRSSLDSTMKQGETVRSEYSLSEIPAPKKIHHRIQDVFILKRKSDVEGRNFKRIAKAIRLLCSR